MRRWIEGGKWTVASAHHAMAPAHHSGTPMHHAGAHAAPRHAVHERRTESARGGRGVSVCDHAAGKHGGGAEGNEFGSSFHRRLPLLDATANPSLSSN
jgi:hypothetical protein